MKNLLKKIGFGAYHITMQQGDGKTFAYYTAKMIISFVPVLWFLILSIILSISFKFRGWVYPSWFLIVFFLLNLFLIKTDKSEFDAIWDSNDEQFKKECVKTFWLYVFGPIVILLLFLVVGKLIGKI